MGWVGKGSVYLVSNFELHDVPRPWMMIREEEERREARGTRTMAPSVLE